MGSAPSLLSMVRVTSARPSGGREAVPAKTTSSILPPRRVLTPCSPITQEKASTTLDLPDPFGPTTHVMPGSKRMDVAEAKDLNPRRVSVFRYTRGLSSPFGRCPVRRRSGQGAPPSLPWADTARRPAFRTLPRPAGYPGNSRSYTAQRRLPQASGGQTKRDAARASLVRNVAPAASGERWLALPVSDQQFVPDPSGQCVILVLEPYQLGFQVTHTLLK